MRELTVQEMELVAGGAAPALLVVIKLAGGTKITVSVSKYGLAALLTAGAAIIAILGYDNGEGGGCP